LRYAKDVTKRLQKLNCIVEWLDVDQLNLSPKDDCVDWLALQANTSKEMIETLPRCLSVDDNIISVSSHGKDNESNSDDDSVAEPSFCGFLQLSDGVYYVDDKGRHRICSPLIVKAWVRDSASENWGRLLEFADPDSHLHRLVIPMEMMKGSGEEVKGLLLNAGLIIESGHRTKNLLLNYITTSETGVNTRGRCVTRTGWHENVFVLPEQTIGSHSELIVYQGDYVAKDYQQSGTLAEWRDQISTLCIDLKKKARKTFQDEILCFLLKRIKFARFCLARKSTRRKQLHDDIYA
jgi:hypothetical protein